MLRLNRLHPSVSSAVAVEFQPLETRRLLAATTVSGSNGADEIRVYFASNTIVVDVNGIANSYPDFLYDGVVVNALGGADTIIVDSAGANGVTINGGSGADTIEIGKTDLSLDGLEAAVSIASSSAADHVYLHSENDAFDATYNITSTGVTKLGYPLISTSDSAVVRILAGAGEDTFVVAGTRADNRVELFGGGADDAFDIRDTNGATVVVDGQDGADLLTVNANLGTPAAVTIESSQDLSRIDATNGATINVTGAAGILLTTKQSDMEGDITLGSGYVIERNSQAAGGLGYWKQRLIGAQTNVTPSLKSSVAAASSVNDGIGYAYAQEIALSEVAGVPIDAGDLLLRYTLGGDTNLDLTVNFTDLLTLAQSYSSTTTGREWTTGDFSFDGLTNFTDLLTLAQNYGQTASLTIAVPAKTKSRGGVASVLS